MVFTLENDQLLYLVKEMPHSEVMHKKQYEDDHIVLYTYKIKNSDRSTVIGYRVDFKNNSFCYYPHGNKMLALTFSNVKENLEIKQELKYDDSQLRILTMHQNKYFILAKINKRNKKGL
jgi:hypothetical protein